MTMIYATNTASLTAYRLDHGISVFDAFEAGSVTFRHLIGTFGESRAAVVDRICDVPAAVLRRRKMSGAGTRQTDRYLARMAVQLRDSVTVPLTPRLLAVPRLVSRSTVVGVRRSAWRRERLSIGDADQWNVLTWFDAPRCTRRPVSVVGVIVHDGQVSGRSHRHIQFHGRFLMPCARTRQFATTLQIYYSLLRDRPTH